MSPAIPNATRPISRLDRPWTSASTATVVGPLHAPTRQALVEAIARTAERWPESRLGWSIDESGRRWRRPAPAHLDAVADGMVTDLDADPSLDYGRFLTGLVHDKREDRPLAFSVGHDHVALRMSHAIGDGRALVALLSRLLETAATGEPVPFPPRPVMPPFVSALGDFFGRSPKRVLAAARAIRHAPSAAEVATRPWSPQRVTLYQRIPGELAAEVRRWRKTSASGATSAAVGLSLVMRALDLSGVPISPEVRVLYDVRRYLPAQYPELHGNFSVGLLMAMSAAMPAARIAELIARAGAVGRPLTALGAGLMFGRRPPASPVTAPLRPQAELAFTYLGRPLPIERLPWRAGRVPVWSGSVQPAGPQGLTFAVTETGRAVHLSASFHAGVLDTGRIGHALTLMAADPIAVLNGRDSPRPAIENLGV
ncbi:hypothetical protein [Couchioplanes caeruleus]|uniref:Diacylglycerol O-acyltransferase n=2 Tax=Couchioplanes caeruleus TaxID=56438 RepID=A0A1K0FHD6_9ACTN|nr:hypothetical protein [Couchioplanes caeruleus]OJF12241.1 hypothetical protein BG844_21865 [Couchioplanes caeruleus subsp. caeruleus]ROP32062.1 hypothetical protein EDD30_4992 [Couchioplanes caeruleus]